MRSFRFLDSRFFLQLAIAHAFLGIVVGIVPIIAYFWGILVLVLGIYEILQTRDRYLAAAKYSAYYMAMEAILRVTKGYLTWEFSKYGVILMLLLGIISSRYQKVSSVFVLLFLLLIPSLAVIDYPNLNEARTSILFNLSGPACLVVSGIYFFRRRISVENLLDILRYAILPIVALVSYLTIFTPDLETIQFGSEAVFETSGGFGPNQMATILGFGMSILIINLFLGKPMFKYKVLDISLLLLLLFRSLITFSRGGTFSVLIVLSVFILILFLKGKSYKLKGSIAAFLFIVAGFFLTWNYTNRITKDSLLYRYQGVNAQTGKKEEITSGRLVILQSELLHFVENPILGIGPGMGKIFRKREFGITVSAHSEFSRLLGEHGVFGLISILIILGIPIYIFFTNQNGVMIAITLVWSALAIYTMFHSAMRLAMPGFLYGLGLVSLFVPQKKHTVHRKSVDRPWLHSYRNR